MEKNKSKTLSANYNYKRKPRQQISDKFLENGSFYIFSRKFLKFKCRLFERQGVYYAKIKSLQVDDQIDLDMINLLAKIFVIIEKLNAIKFLN